MMIQYEPRIGDLNGLELGQYIQHGCLICEIILVFCPYLSKNVLF